MNTSPNNTVLVTNNDLSAAIRTVSKAIDDMGPHLHGFNLTDLVSDRFPHWPPFYVRTVINMLFNYKMLGYTILKTEK